MTWARQANWRTPLVLVFAGVVAVLLFFGPTDNWLWDPSFYYVQLRAPLIDHNLDWSSETQPPNGIPFRTSKGLQPSPWPVGPALMWSPFFLATHVYVLLTDPSSANGWTLPYLAATAASSMVYGLIGVLVVYHLCCHFGPRGLAVVTALLVLFATPLFFYVFRQPMMAHSTSLLASACLMLVCVLLDNDVLPWRYAGVSMGVFTGLSMLLRWTSVLLAIIPLGLLAWAFWDALRQCHWHRLRQVVTQGLVFGGTAGMMVLPQLALWHALHGQWLVFPSQGFSEQTIGTNAANVFVHTNRGLVWWAPFIVVGMLGLVRLRRRRLQISMMVYLAALVGVLGLWHDWYGGGGYGPRYFIEALPVVAIGFAVLFGKLWQRAAGRWFVTLLAGAAIVHQWVLLLSVEQTWITPLNYRHGEPLGLGFQAANLQRMLQTPALMLGPRPYVDAARQTAVATFMTGNHDLASYAFAGVAAAVVVLGLSGYVVARKQSPQRLVGGATLGLLVLALGWSWVLLKQ